MRMNRINKNYSPSVPIAIVAPRKIKKFPKKLTFQNLNYFPDFGRGAIVLLVTDLVKGYFYQIPLKDLVNINLTFITIGRYWS